MRREPDFFGEVELPLVQQAWPGAAVLPIEVPLIEQAIEIGRRTAREVMAAKLRPVFLASSDLTHYGVNYGFAPAGLGMHGLNWAKENDRRLAERPRMWRRASRCRRR